MTLENILSNVTEPSNRLFGVEIEVNGINRNSASDALNSIGIPTRSEDYNHTRRTWWKATRDGSLSGGAQSCEIVSPPLPYNRDSLLLVAKVIQTLRDNGATVDNSCGIHVHIDARNVTSNMDLFSRILFLKYRENEEKIDLLVAESRRGNSNRFCMSMQNFGRDVNYTRLRQDRYYKLNFASFERHGTIEFRQHEGSLNDKKVVAWIIFCMGFFETSLNFMLNQGRAQIQTMLSQSSSW